MRAGASGILHSVATDFKLLQFLGSVKNIPPNVEYIDVFYSFIITNISRAGLVLIWPPNIARGTTNTPSNNASFFKSQMPKNMGTSRTPLDSTAYVGYYRQM